MRRTLLSCRPVRPAISAERVTLPLELQQFMMRRRTQGQEPFPQFIGLGDFAGLWLGRVRRLIASR